MKTFIEKVPLFIKTIAELTALQGLSTESAILKSAKFRIVETGYDNWDGGITFYSLLLEIPLKLFSGVENIKELLEKTIQNKLEQLTRTDSGNRITEVIISPGLIEGELQEERDVTLDKNNEMMPSFWQQGYFRVFISHSVSIKEKAHELKEALIPYQITSFVAHDDIEPGHEWQVEIENALKTMDALVAIISPEFLGSKWCDQEVGYALGRNKLVIPISRGATPHGFIGKIQGLQSNGLEAKTIVEKIVDILIQNELSSPRITEVLVEKLVKSGSWESSKFTMTLLEKAPKITSEQAGRLLKSVEENVDVSKSWGVPERINKLIERMGISKQNQ